jgi:hypothetical protein
MKRFIFLSTQFLIFVIIEISNWLGIFLDEIFYSSYKKVDIISPKYIIGMPRSGTTYLHRLLAADKSHFTSMRFWEILFAPSIIQKKILLAIRKIDKKFKNRLATKILKWEKNLFRKYESIHPLSFFNVEEDDYILVHVLSTVHLIFPFPEIKYFNSFIQFDESLTEKRKRRIMSFYKKCVQKHMYVFGRNKTYLAKSPAHTSKLKSIKKIFPDSNFIYIVRKPHQAISSTIGLLNMFCDVFFTPVDRDSINLHALELADYSYRSPFLKSKSWPKGQIIVVKFENLILDPLLSVAKIYNHFGCQLSSEYETFLACENKKTLTYKSGHSHSLDMYKLEISEIKKKYDYIYKEYYNEL